MAEQQITYTEKVEKTESVTVCDGCGLEVEPGENCRTVVGHDGGDDYGDEVFKKLAHKLGSDHAFKFAEKNCVELNGLVYVPTHRLFEQLDSTYHFCFDCWSEVNLNLDGESADMVAQYEDRVREDVRAELLDEWSSKSMFSRLGNAAFMDLFVTAASLVLFVVLVLINIPNILTAIPATLFAIGMIAIFGRYD